ncbi:MAG: dihydropteroate synthase [Planctomycetota bacterium]
MTRRGSLDDFTRVEGPTRVVGILNVTPDSFSDGGVHPDVASAVDAALRMEEAGAAVIDVGAVSTRPGSEAVDLEEERRRLMPVIEALAPRLEVPISVDTFRAAIFREAFEAGAAILNDVTALGEGEAMFEVLRRTGAPAILMHMRGRPSSMQDDPRYDDVTAEVAAFFAERLDRAEAAGLPRDRFVLDPGLGFGKTVEHNLALLARSDELAALGRPLLYGASRKSFLGKILDRLDPREREWGTAATTAHLAGARVRYVRVHDVAAAVDVIRVIDRIGDFRTGTVPS